MGYIRHHAIAVTSGGMEIKKAHTKAKKIFGNRTSKIIKSNINGFESFFIAPDGSKEGWEDSNKGDDQRHEFIDYLENNLINYCEFFYGDDNGESKVLNHN